MTFARRRTRRHRRTTHELSQFENPDDDTPSYMDETDAEGGDVWDVGRSGWPHDRIRGWKQLSGYVVAASIGIGVSAAGSCAPCAMKL